MHTSKLHINLSNLFSASNYVRYTVLSLVMLIVCGLGFVFDSYGLLIEVKKLKGENSLLLSSLETKTIYTVEFDEEIIKNNKFSEQLNNLMLSIPSHEYIADHLNNITSIGLANGLVFTLYKPEVILINDLFSVIPINVKLFGTYNEICLFISGLSALQKLVTIHEIKLTPFDTNGKLIMSAIIKTYFDKNNSKKSDTLMLGADKYDTYNPEGKNNPFLPDPTEDIKKISTPQFNHSINVNINHPKEALESFPMNTLKLQGTVFYQNDYWALIKSVDSEVYRVKVGNYIGTHYGKIISITSNNIYIQETYEDKPNVWHEQITTMSLVQ